MDKYAVCHIYVDRWQETRTDDWMQYIDPGLKAKLPFLIQSNDNALNDGGKAVCEITEPIEIKTDYSADIL